MRRRSGPLYQLLDPAELTGEPEPAAPSELGHGSLDAPAPGAATPVEPRRRLPRGSRVLAVCALGLSLAPVVVIASEPPRPPQPRAERAPAAARVLRNRPPREPKPRRPRPHHRSL